MSHYNEQREADEVWKNAPEGAEYVVEFRGQFQFYQYDTLGDLMTYYGKDWRKSEYDSISQIDKLGFRVMYRPKTHQNEPAPLKPQNPYQRTIIGLDGSKCAADVYRVLDAFKTDSPALDHAVKKILCPGTRHQKDREQDLKEAIKSIEAELLLMEQRND